MAYQPTQQAEVTAFVTTTPLAAAATFTSAVLDAAGVTQVQTEINSNQNGTIDIEFCDDAAGLNIIRSLSIPYSAANGYQFFSAPAFVNFIRYKFTNTSGSTNTIYYTTKFLTTALSPQLLTTKAFIAEAMVTTLGRNIIVGQNDAGTFNNVNLDNQNHLEVNVSNPKTAYDELAVANLSPIVQLTFPYNINSDIVDVAEVAGGTVTQATNMAILNTSATTASSATVTSIEQAPFRAGQGHLARFSCLFTGTPTVPTASATIGVGDADDGYSFLLNSTAFGIEYRTNGAHGPIIAQQDWNVDVLDGTGSSSNPSGMDLDITKGNSYQIAYGSGFGTVNFSVESDVSGDYILVHVLALANTLAASSTYNPTFPMRAEVINGAGTDDITISVASMASFIEGDNVVTGPINAYENSKSIAGIETSVFSLSNLTTFATKANKVPALLSSLSMVNDTNAPGFFRIWQDATLGGSPVYNPINAGLSVMEVDIAGTTVSGGKLIWAGGVGKDNGDSIDLSSLNIKMRPGSTYTFTAQGGASNTMAVSAVWQEDF